ncbi:S8 family peptidase [Billgrantia desiderata]|uniref:S8 family peptidase n=1 Tax=Billgrantia desiderata TaxID=52021 RepID=UPI003F40A1EB
MAERNLLLGRGELLSSQRGFSNGGGPKKYPYSFSEVQGVLPDQIRAVEESLDSLPAEAKPRGEGVFELILHPAFLAKSYYPVAIFDSAGLRDVGSKEVFLRPRKVTRKRDEEKELATASIFVAGSVGSLRRLRAMVEDGKANKKQQSELREIEEISWIERSRCFKGDLSEDEEETKQYEVVLHAGPDEKDIIDSFVKFAKSCGAEPQVKKMIQVGKLTFIPVVAVSAVISRVIQHSFVRVARVMPLLRSAVPEIMRNNLSESLPLPKDTALKEDVVAAIFDGGLGTSDLSQWADEYIWEDTEHTYGNLLLHGNEVTSTYLFGRVDDGRVLKRPFTKVNHFRVLGQNSGKDPDLYDVLLKIKSELEYGDYRFVNLSLGPRMPIHDDEVHAWTAVLDQLCSRHGIFATVAVGNDGDVEGAERIQPPGDMVNALSVGASDRSGSKWSRAPYSCMGPGRSPGYIKPDGLAFGGSDTEPFLVFNPMTASVNAVCGTSYSAPMVLRTAAGVAALTDYDMSSNALKALLVHTADPKKSTMRKEVGWGRFKEDPIEILECDDESATVIFQGNLVKGEYLRCPIPMPNEVLSGEVKVKATFCIQAHTDPEHSLNYTRSGIGIVFRPRVGVQEEDSSDFFGIGSQYYRTEREYRDGAHKWETCIHRDKRFTVPVQLVDPVFDIEYFSREESRNVHYQSAPDVGYALVITVKAEGVSDIYNKIRQRYSVLSPVNIPLDITLDGR